MQATEAAYKTVRKSEFEPIADIIDEMLREMGIDAECAAGDMSGAIRPEQRDASRVLDLIAEIEGTE